MRALPTKLNPASSGQLRVELAQELAASGHFRSATEAYFDAFGDGFHHPLILTNLGASLYYEGRVPEAIIAYRCALSKDRRFAPAWSNLLLALNCMDGITPRELAEEHRAFGDQFDQPVPITRPRRPGKLRIGFVSSSFFRHSVTQFLEPVFRVLNRDTFQILCYQSSSRVDAMTERLIASADQWRVVASMSDAEAIETIRGDDIDVLIDLDGHTGLNRLALFAARPARVQLCWLGYPNSTGLRSMDYRLTDPVADPAPFSDGLHTEQLIRIDSPFLVYAQPEDSPPLAPAPAAKNGYATFGIFNQLHKLSNSFVSAVGRTLQSVPNSHLLLKCAALADPLVCAAILERFTTRGIDRSRISFVGPIQSHRGHLESHERVDIMLDTFPYTGTTTTCEALWMGVPVVTLEGLTHQARVGSSLLQSVGLPNLVGKDVDEYVSIAGCLASDPLGLAVMRSQMRERMLSSPLMDLPAFVKRFENALLYSARNAVA